MLFLWLVLIQIVIFGFLVLFLKTILTRNITSATAHLHELNEDYLQKIEEAKRREQEAEKYYDDMVLKSKSDAEKAKVQILKEAHEAEEGIVSKARVESEEILAKANLAREMFLSELEEKVRLRAVDEASDILLGIMPREASKALHERWTTDLLKSELDQIARLHLPEELREAQLVSAHELSPDSRKSIEKKVEECLKRKIAFSEKVDPVLIAGIKIILGSVVIDGSLQFKIKEATRHARNGK